MIVVSDTSPLNYLILIGEVRLLPELFGRVVSPPAVVSELSHPGAPEPVRGWAASLPSWLEVIAPSQVDTSLGLGVGETEAICLATELKANAVLIDERKGFLVAQRLGLVVTGTLGILELAAQAGMVNLTAALTALRCTTFRASEELLDELVRRDVERRNRTLEG